MMMPHEASSGKNLMYSCENCSNKIYVEPCSVYHDQVKKSIKQQNFSKNVRLDPTLPRARDVVCKECGERGAVYFQAHGANNQAMSLIYVCVNCGAFWDNREKEEQ